MRTSSTRLRFGGAIAATSLSLLVGFGGTAFADAGGQGEAHRNERAGNERDASPTVTEDTDANDGTANNVVDNDDNAHPSGNDRSVENGGSGNQGNATSEPDGNDNGPERDFGGIDQPGQDGGRDLADQDGNNGCGNDDDFEDDNEGNCGKPEKPVTPSTPVTTPTTVVVNSGTDSPTLVLGAQVQNDKPATPTQVLGASVERSAVAAPSVDTAASVTPAATVLATSAVAAPTAPTTSVLGATAVRGASLARTGFGTVTMVLVALSLLLVGFAMVRRPKGAHFTA